MGEWVGWCVVGVCIYVYVYVDDLDWCNRNNASTRSNVRDHTVLAYPIGAI